MPKALLQRVLLVDMMSGSNDYGRELAASLSTGCELTVVTVEDSSLAEMPGIRCLSVFPAFGGIAGKFSKLVRSLSAFRILIVEAWRHRDSVVHVQFFRYGWVDILLYLLLMPWLNRFVYTAHNTLPHEAAWWHRHLYRHWYKKVHVIHVLSSYARAGVVGLAGISLDKVRVVPHGCYSDLYARTSISQGVNASRLAIPKSNKIGLVFGLVREYKGIDLLIRASVDLPPGLPLTFVVAGGGQSELFERYISLAAELGVSDRFVFKQGYLPDEELAAFLRLADFTILPYRGIYQSGALMMAMTFGVPMVVSNMPGFLEYVAHDEGALVCDCTSQEQFARTLMRITEDDELRVKMSRSLRAQATTKYSWASISEQILDIYRVD